MKYAVICIGIVFLALFFGVLLCGGKWRDLREIWGKMLWIGGAVVLVGVCLWLFQKIFS